MPFIYATRNVYSPQERLFLSEIALQGLETVPLETEGWIGNPLIVPVVICKGSFPHRKDLCAHPDEFELCKIALPTWAPYAHFALAFNAEMDFHDRTRRRELQKDILATHEKFESAYRAAITGEHSLPRLLPAARLPRAQEQEKPRMARTCW